MMCAGHSYVCRAQPSYDVCRAQSLTCAGHSYDVCRAQL